MVSKKLAVFAMALFLPVAAHASVIYDLTLTSSNAAYSGNGMITLDAAPSATGLSSYASGQYSDLSFIVDGQTFSAPTGSVSAVEFLDGDFYDITFAEQTGVSPNRYALDTTANYALSYNNLQSVATGTISSSLAQAPAAVPEPGTLAVMITGILGLLLIRRRRSA